MTADQPATRLEPSSDTDAIYARIFESGRQAGLTEDYEFRQRAEAAIRCCETGHRPAYRKGRLAGQDDHFDAINRAHRAGQRRGAIRALVVVAGLGAFALWFGRRG